MHNGPFTTTFIPWFASGNLDDIIRPEPPTHRDAVDLRLSVGHGALDGCAYPYVLNVAAILRAEWRDPVYTDELVAEQSSDGWSCGLCLDDPPINYRSIEELCIDHLLNPFGRWVADKLRVARGIAFLQ